MAEKEISELKKALIERAQRLAHEARQQARDQREQVIHDANERLRLREEREVLYAKDLAERVHRRKVQASELRIQGDLDRLRWEMVQCVLESAKERLAALATSYNDYMPVFVDLLSHAARCIPKNELVAEVNQRDRERFVGDWDQIVNEAAPNKRIHLAQQPFDCIGGVRVTDVDETIRVDNTFDGRIERFRDELNASVLERVFGHALTVEDLMHG